MLIDLRVYTYLPGKFTKFLKSYEEVGFALTSRYLGRTLGVFTAESGVQNRTFQFFMYEDSAHRDRCRQAMLADPKWYEFVKMDADALLQQTNLLARPTAFSPIGGAHTATSTPLSADHRLRLFELNTWTCQMNQLDAVLALLGNGGAAVLERHEAHSIAYLVADTGNEHQILWLLAYDSATDRDRRKELARTDREVRSLRSSLRSLLVCEDATLLCPTRYSPLR